MSHVIELMIAWVLIIIARFGYLGIFVTMALESAAVPIPSEVVLPFSGFLASSGQLNFWLVVLVATLANLSGGLVIYVIGEVGGGPFLNRYGKYFLVHYDDITRLDHWLGRHQRATIFFSRLLPGVRTFASLIVGVSPEVRVRTFIIYTLAGSFIWNLGLAYVGFFAGSNWNFLHPYFQKFEIAIGALILAAVIVFISKHFKNIKIKNQSGK